jgi:repressor LexA
MVHLLHGMFTFDNTHAFNILVMFAIVNTLFKIFLFCMLLRTLNVYNGEKSKGEHLMTINEYLKTLRESRGLSQRGVALKMGVSNSTISQIESDRNKPSMDILILYEKHLGGDMNTMLKLFKGEEPMDLPYTIDDVQEVDMTLKVPLVGSVRAGQPILAQDNIEEYLLFDKKRFNPENVYFALRVVGDSMDKLFRPGDIVLVEKTEAIETGQIAVVGINGYEATVKRVTLGDGNIALIPESNNPAYTTKVYSMSKDEIHIIGRVVQSTTYF